MSSNEELMKQIETLKEQLKSVQEENSKLKSGEWSLDEADLPTEGDIWEMMKKHVLDNTDDDEKLEYIEGESVRNTWKLGELYDKEEIVEHIRKSDVPPEAIYTPTQLSQSCGRLNKELLADNERIRAKNSEIVAKHNKLVDENKEIQVENEMIGSKNSERIVKHNELVAEIERIGALNGKLTTENILASVKYNHLQSAYNAAAACGSFYR
jgi:hypothetical protein